MASRTTSLGEKTKYRTHTAAESLKYFLGVAGLFSVIFGSAVVVDKIMEKDK